MYGPLDMVTLTGEKVSAQIKQKNTDSVALM